MYVYVMSIFMFLLMIILMIIYMMSYKNLFNKESSSSYECGFNLISSSRSVFSFRFFLLSILFLIFDVEITLLLGVPYVCLSEVGAGIFMIFVFVLIIGLLYEYHCGSLEWL